MQDHLSAIFLISKHGSVAKREEAQCILDRYTGKKFSYHTGWDKHPASPLADWNRMGAYVMSSFAHVERSYEAAQVNLRQAELLEKLVGAKNAAKMTTKPESVVIKLKRHKMDTPRRQACGKAQSGNLQSWTKALKKARENYGIAGNTMVKKDSDCYKLAKRLRRADA